MVKYNSNGNFHIGTVTILYRSEDDRALMWELHYGNEKWTMMDEDKIKLHWKSLTHTEMNC